MLNYQLMANAVRMLAIDGVEKAKSGHPGAPMGLADIATTLWRGFLKHNPKNPNWLNRDRFILSNGHASMLQYALLHLTGYDLSIEDIKNFRQFKSKTPGHPEYGYTPGVETTTGPLGQGLANAVGMALGEKLLSAEFNRENYPIIDHHTYVIAGDGCLMEGISHEVCSLAGTWGLNKLIAFYDDNGISIDGEVQAWFNEDVKARFLAYKWNVIGPINGHDFNAIKQAIVEAKQSANKPTLIICKTTIGFGSPNKSGREECHGSPLGAKEIELVRKELNWHYLPFEIPNQIYQDFNCGAQGDTIENQWQELFNSYSQQYPKLAAELLRRVYHQLPQEFNQILKQALASANQKQETVASRKASQIAINYYADYFPEFLGGSADLTGSNLTNWNNSVSINQENHFTGNYISYGVREFGMSAIINGIYLYGGFRPFGGTFLMFSEYARNALRMAALMKIAPIFVYTHDSIGLGEDGPTHQAVEQLASLRLIPNFNVWRPADSTETIAAWGDALSRTKTPSALILSRQNLDFIARTDSQLDLILKGGYILESDNEVVDIAIMASGSELGLALKVAKELRTQAKSVRVISMPSTTVFDSQDLDYRQQVLGKVSHLMVAIEAGVSDTWYKYVGRNGLIIGLDNFGESAPANVLFEHFGFNVENIIKKILTHTACVCSQKVV